MTTILFIQGAHKTATSTLLGLLNCHPQIFLLYETCLFNSLISKYGKQLIQHDIEWRKYFYNTSNIESNYVAAAEKILRNKYKYFGDKIISLDHSLLKNRDTFKIFTTRSLLTWLCKPSVIAAYRTDIDVIRPSIDFTIFLIECKKIDRSITISLEDFIYRFEQTVYRLSSFLNIEINEISENWWSDVDAFVGVKAMQKWQRSHPSSLIPLNSEDTTAEMGSDEDFNNIVQIFNKYHKNTECLFPTNEMNDDIRYLEACRGKRMVPLIAAISRHEYRSVSVGNHRNSFFKKILKKR
jgi:hypothetical protein